jgi:hypothetical protein
MCTASIQIPADTEEGLDPLELELRMVVSHHAGVENQTQALWENSKCPYLLCHLSSPQMYIWNESKDQVYIPCNNSISILSVSESFKKNVWLFNYLGVNSYPLSMKMNIYQAYV